MPILTKLLLSHILDNELLTRGLGDAEARMLVEWLVDQAEQIAADAPCEQTAQERIQCLCRRGRAIGRFVGLWSQPRGRGAAGQLAVAEGFTWPLPPPTADTYEVMQTVLVWETGQPVKQVNAVA
ncbi:MAG TPA: hypothetical protein VKU02_01185 [Gemmataceae bacterium]|nr:hypothetical protein [Gemmataceae bacterium]